MRPFRPLWNQRQRYRSDVKNGSLLLAIKNNPGFFSDTPILCLIWDEDITTKDLASLKKKEPAFATNVGWPYQEWPVFPRNAWFIDISLVGPHPIVSGFGRTFDNLWRVKTPVGTFEIVVPASIRNETPWPARIKGSREGCRFPLSILRVRPCRAQSSDRSAHSELSFAIPLSISNPTVLSLLRRRHDGLS